MENKIKLIIVEDHALTRIGLKTALEESNNLEVTGEAECGEAGVQLVKQMEPDVVIMDLGLPNMNGIDATKSIKEFNSKIKVIILTSHQNEEQVIGAFAAGADAYCMKDINPSRLITIIENVAGGGVWLDPAIAGIILNRILIDNSHCKLEKIDRQFCPLTQREIEILQLLVNGMSNIEIANELSLSQYTIKAHISNILQKLSVDDRTQAAVRALRQGWVQ